MSNMINGFIFNDICHPLWSLTEHVLLIALVFSSSETVKKNVLTGDEFDFFVFTS